MNRIGSTQTIIARKSSNLLSLNSFRTLLNQKMRLMAAATFGLTAIVLWWIWQSETKYIGKFYLLLTPTLQNASAGTTEISDNEREISTQAELVRSSKVLEPILEKLFLQYPDLKTDYLNQQNHLKKSPLVIKRLEQTKILEISYEDQDPQKIEQVLSQLAQGYVNYGTKSQQAQFNQQSGIIKKEVTQIHQKLSQSQKQLDTFRQQYSLYNPEQQGMLLTEQLAKLELESYQTQVQLQETTTLYKTLEQQLKVTPEQAIASSDLSSSLYYQNLVKKLQEVELKLAQETTIFRDASPNIQVLKEQQKNLQKLIKKEEEKVAKYGKTPVTIQTVPNSLRLTLSQQYIQAANNLQILQSRKTALVKQIQTLKNQIQRLPILARQYTELQQKFDREQKSLNRFLTTQEQLKNSGIQSSPWQVLSKPQLSESITSPDPQENLVLGLLSGLSLGLLLSVLSEMLVSPQKN